jgi:hypothetical protein
MADDIAKMRAALSSSWEDDSPIPQMPAPANSLDLIKAAYQNMPGAGIGQAGVAMGSDILGQLLGNLYGAGKSIAQGQYGTNAGINNAFNTAQQFANQMHYTPPTQAGRDIYEGVNKLPQVLTGSHMGIGPLPELMGMNARFTPDDLRVAGRTATQDIRNFPIDYANAKAGVQREYPTAGSRAAQFTDVAGNLAKPLAEKAYDIYMNPESSVEVMGLRPGANLSGLFDVGQPMYAVKPKGGNWPTNLGSTLPLSKQGGLGEYLSASQYSDPIAVFEQQLQKHFRRSTDNRQLLRDFEDYRTQRIGLALDPNSPDRYLSNEELSRKIADEFAHLYNNGTIGSVDIEPTDKKLYTASQIAEALPHYNSWVMGPFQKYITNQMGTGLATDPLLQAVNESGMPPHEIFGQDIPKDWEIDSITKRAVNRREDFPNRLFGYSDTPKKMAALENSPIGKVTATTPEGIDYENALDASLYAKSPYSFKDKNRALTGDNTEFPVIAKLDNNTLISDFLTNPEQRTGFDEIKKQVFQDLISGNLDPNKLSNVTPATVTRQMIKNKMAEFKEAQLNKQNAADWIPKRAAAMPTDMAFSDGSKMTIITPEMANADENMTSRDLGQITIDLNQCVGSGCHATQDYPGHGPWLVPHTGKPPRGKVEVDKYGYLRRLKNGEIEIASLKDPNGLSQATLELKPESNTLRNREAKIINWFRSQGLSDAKYEFTDNTINFGLEKAIDNAFQLYPELRNISLSTEKSVQQIKGYSNGDIKEEYVPQVVEWLNANADKLTDVRELNHLPNVHDLTRSYDSVGKLMDKNNHWDADTVEQFFNKVIDENLLPRFFTNDDFALKATELGVDLSAGLPKELKFHRLTDLQKDVISANVYDYLNNPDLIDMENLAEPYKTDIKILAGDQNERAKLPTDMHNDLIYILLNQDENVRSIRRMLDELENPGYFIHMPELNTPQLENILNMLTSWTERYPLAE